MSNIAAAPIVNKKGETTVQPAKVQRYWKGKAPIYSNDGELHDSSSSSEEADGGSENDENGIEKLTKRIAFGRKAEQVEESVPFTRIDVPLSTVHQDRRLQRIKAISGPSSRNRYSRSENDQHPAKNLEENEGSIGGRSRRRKIEENEDDLEPEEDEDEEEDEEEYEEDEANDSVLAHKKDELESSDTESSSEEEGAISAPRLKPIFVPRCVQNNLLYCFLESSSNFYV
jgi:microfibrillar-associated protein 1